MPVTTSKMAAAAPAMPAAGQPPSAAEGANGRVGRWLLQLTALLSRIPHSAIALLARFSLAAVFWSSGQTKVQGLAINIVSGEFQLGWPHLAPQAVDLFRAVHDGRVKFLWVMATNPAVSMPDAGFVRDEQAHRAAGEVDFDLGIERSRRCRIDEGCGSEIGSLELDRPEQDGELFALVAHSNFAPGSTRATWAR